MQPINAIVYQARNLVNGHRYIGFTTQGLSVRERKHRKIGQRSEGGFHFHSALRKYGDENFVFELLGGFGDDEDLAKMYEREAIEAYKPEYNLSHGGEGGSMPEITRQRISAANKGRVGPMLGRKFTLEHCAKIRANTKGKPHMAVRGVPLSEERRRKISAAVMGPPGNGRKAVLCVTDGVTHVSLSAAAKYYSTSIGYISQVAKGTRLQLKGLVFKFVEET